MLLNFCCESLNVSMSLARSFGLCWIWQGCSIRIAIISMHLKRTSSVCWVSERMKMSGWYRRVDRVCDCGYLMMVWGCGEKCLILLYRGLFWKMISRAGWMCRSGSLCWSHRSFPALFCWLNTVWLYDRFSLSFLWVDESIIFGVLLHFWLLRYFHDIWWEWYAVHFQWMSL